MVCPAKGMVLRMTRYLTSGLTDEALRLQASYKMTTIKLRNSINLNKMALAKSRVMHRIICKSQTMQKVVFYKNILPYLI